VKTLYDAPANSSAAAVFRSYQTALQQAGFDTLFTCAKEQCSKGGRIGATMHTVRKFDLRGAAFEDNDTYLLAGHQAKNDIYVVLYVASYFYHPEHVSYMVDVVEVKPLETGLATVNAAAMASDITVAGHTPVYGIYFDTGKAEIKPESKAVLDEIAKLLRNQASLKLTVVGHTDNVGVLASNMQLSKQRADAVVAALVSQYQIAASRLQAGGVGSLSPVATNRTEEGRAKNRRVELVEQ
jgi:outer membrane protein OmpA-like peptidoglycan-associated protein